MTTLLMMAMLAGAAEGQDAAPARKELQRPADWVTRADEGDDAAATLYFVSMPPGWHITTGPGVILYDPAKSCQVPCRIEAEIYLFPGKSEGGYGVFFEGVGLDSQEGPNYDTLLLRWDGAVARANWINGKRVPPSRWEPHFAHRVAKALPDKPVKNVITIDFGEEDGRRVGRFLVNGESVRTEYFRPNLPRRLPHGGLVGLRVDAGVNIHVTRLDVIQK
jgi:hypothetical protein